MKNKLLISVASAALIGMSGIALAQAPAPQSQGGASQAAPAARGGEGMSGAPREGAAEQRGQPGEMKGKGNDMNGGKAAQNKAGSDEGMKGNRNAAEQRPSDSKGPNAKSASDTKSDSKSGVTTGQAAAGGKQMTTEQRTTIRTSITKQNIKPVTNVNFSISVGTRVPRGIAFHPLPVEVVNIYPNWRGYEFILVNDEIVVINPRTLEIVAVLEA
ncbi:MAG: DUF1236 domain-containing protein [Afipia sp.]|nr:DUF1236 domain-containing protein [Afipia sp.]